MPQVRLGYFYEEICQNEIILHIVQQNQKDIYCINRRDFSRRASSVFALINAQIPIRGVMINESHIKITVKAGKTPRTTTTFNGMQRRDVMTLVDGV